MGLHDRIKGAGSDNGAAISVAEVSNLAQSQERAKTADPYAELKTRVHHAVIARLGPELFAGESAEDLSERVLRAVMEQLALDRTPLTREERRQIVKEITDDILGYGPLEPFLRDDSITEVMVNAYDQIYVERHGKLERVPAAFVDNARSEERRV